MDCLLLVSSESDSAALAPPEDLCVLVGPVVHNPSVLATLEPVRESLCQRRPGVWQVRVSLGRGPRSHRYRYAATTVRGSQRDAQRAAARLVSEAAEGRIPLTKETFGGLLIRWLDPIEARG